jgi:hypothetical protein
MENESVTINAGASHDLKTTVSGSCSMPGAVVTISSWLKSGGRIRECYGSCTASADGTWTIADFLLLLPEYFVENDRVCCVQAAVQASSGVITSTVVEITVDIPYTAEGSVLKANSYNALVCALIVAPKQTLLYSVRLEADLTVTAPVIPSLACLFNGASHTITCLSHTLYVPLFDKIEPAAELKALKVVYPDWKLTTLNDTPPACFAGIVRENGGVIDGCTVQLNVSQEQIECAGVASLSITGSEIRNCTVNGKLTGKSTAGIVHTLLGGTVKNCTVTADLEFAEFAGGIAVSAETGSLAEGCKYTGKLTNSSVAFVATRLCGGVVAKSSGATLTGCHADVEFDLLRSAMGGYGGGVTGQCTNTAISKCGAGVKVNCHWIYGGIAGMMRNGSVVEQSAVFGKESMTESRSVAGGLVGDLGDNCIVRDSYDCQVLRSAVYGGGLAGYNPGSGSGAKIERCYCASSLYVKTGGGIKMSGGAEVVNCAGVWPVLCGNEHIARIGEGGGVTNCIAYNATRNGGGVVITDTGETLMDAAEFGKQSTFTALGWDFSTIWELSAEGHFPKLRNLSYPQTYPYSFLLIVVPATTPYVFSKDEVVRFEGYACTRTTEVKNRIEPVTATDTYTPVTAPVVAGKWTLAVGTLAPGQYKLTQTFVLDGETYIQTAEFTVS